MTKWKLRMRRSQRFWEEDNTSGLRHENVGVHLKQTILGKITKSKKIYKIKKIYSSAKNCATVNLFIYCLIELLLKLIQDGWNKTIVTGIKNWLQECKYQQ